LGALLFARVPVMIRDGNSPIWSLNGMPYCYWRPDSMAAMLVMGNADVFHGDILRDICAQLRTILMAVGQSTNLR
jgi:hypothetical protein